MRRRKETGWEWEGRARKGEEKEEGRDEGEE